MITLNGIQIEPTLFPDNTSQVWKLNENLFKEQKVHIDWEFSHEAELIHLCQLKQLLDASGVNNIQLYIDYLPYARQDKDISNDSTFALNSFALLLNAMKFNEVLIQDPHSIKALNLIDNSYDIYPKSLIKKILIDFDINLICYPDKGAAIKYNVKYNDLGCDVIIGDKVRDQSTGYITDYKIVGTDKIIENKNILIVDDICDGGATFIILAKKLYEMGVKSVNLFVTHGIFSKGLKPLKEAGINKIFTAKGEAVDMGDNIVGYKRF